MTNDEINRRLEEFIQFFESKKVAATQFAATALLPTPYDARRQAHWMAKTARAMSGKKLKRKRRWLAFIQGIVWSLDGSSNALLKGAFDDGDDDG